MCMHTWVKVKLQKYKYNRWLVSMLMYVVIPSSSFTVFYHWGKAWLKVHRISLCYCLQLHVNLQLSQNKKKSSFKKMGIWEYFKRIKHHNKATKQLEIKMYKVGVKLSGQEWGLRSNSDFSPYLLSLVHWPLWLNFYLLPPGSCHFLLSQEQQPERVTQSRIFTWISSLNSQVSF